MDGRRHTLVLIVAGEANLGVGGAAGSGFVVYATFDNEHFHNVLTGADPCGRIQTVVAGGQPGAYADDEVVPLAAAVLAAEGFARDGVLTPALVWSTS